MMFLQAFRKVLYQAWLYVLDRIPLDDPWGRWPQAVPHHIFASGSVNDFGWYLKEPSTVTIDSIEHVCDWLLACEFVTDEEQFGKADYWQHPTEFEKRRRGDCDDHAIWAWRKLIELGIPVELVVGCKRTAAATWAGHAWVQTEVNGQPVVLDAAAKPPSQLIVPLADARAWLRPHFAVDQRLQRHAFEGYLHTIKERRCAARQKPRSPDAAA